MLKEQSKLKSFIEDHSPRSKKPRAKFVVAEQELSNPHLTPETRFNFLIQSGLNAFASGQQAYAKDRLWEATTLYKDLDSDSKPRLKWRAANSYFVLGKIAYQDGSVRQSAELFNLSEELLLQTAACSANTLGQETAPTEITSAVNTRLDLIERARARQLAQERILDFLGGCIDYATGFSFTEAT